MNDDIDLTPVEDIKPKEYPLAAVFWALVILVLVTFGRFAFADTVTYQSQTLAGSASTLVGQTVENSSPINDSYIVTMTVSGPLSPNLNMAMITPQSWSVVCQNCLEALSSSPAQPALPTVLMIATTAVFMFSTDATGKITAWNFAISGNSTVSVYGELASTWGGSFNSNITDVGTSSEWVLTQYRVLTSGPLGTWTQSSLSNPPVAPPTSNVLARTCNSTWATPNNNVPAGLTPNANGSGMNCRMPSQYPPSWYIKITTDGGKTYEFVQLSTLGLGN